VSVVIIGGGITGLAAAYEVAARNIPFVLLETSDRIGGLIFTERVGGFTIESGADSMLAQKPAAIQLCGELGLSSRLVVSTPPRTAYVHARGRLHALPSGAVFGIPTTWPGIAGYSLLPWPARLRLAAGIYTERRSENKHEARQRDADESVADFFRRRFGAATVDLIADPLLGGIHAGDVERLSIRAVAPRLADRATLRDAATTPPSSEGMFRSLAGGMGELVEAIEGRLPAGSIRRRSEAQAISRAGRSWHVASTSGTLDASAIVLAAPAHAAARLVERVDAELAAECAGIPYVSTASIALAWPRTSVAHPLRGSGFVVARRQSTLRITACTWVSSKWQSRAPAGTVLLRAFLGGAADPDAAALSDDAAVEIARHDVSEVLGIREPPSFARVYRWIRAGAQHNVGHSARVGRIEARLAALPGLFVAGSGFRSIGVPDCIADGRAAGAAAARYAGDKIRES
jgi:protoporphyrinogen/coproporphyrinogen III oxidase